ncbi:MAG: hypothetical protein Dbin4_00810 [Alphaproteobacteria bacterium]|nr:hypothetical protein [Alphaproteobacteria bacterium]
MIKTLALLTFTAAAFAMCFQAAYVSLLIWVWLSTMMPQAEAWGSAWLNYSNFIAGILTLSAMFFSSDRKLPPLNLFSFLFFFFIALITLSQIFSLNQTLSFYKFEFGITTLIMAFTIMVMTTSKLKIQALLWVFMLSIGYYGVTRGLYTIATLGGGIVTGPSGTIIDDNNHLAVALAMSAPIGYYLYRSSTDIRARLLAAGISTLSIIAVIGTHSRGGLISLGVMVLGLLLRSKRKALSLIMIVSVIGASLSFMPDKWFQRMGTISSAEKDGSFMGRVEAWEAAYKLALMDPILGVGARLQYYPEYTSLVGMNYGMRATHNAYLEILAGNGFPAFFAFIAMMATSFFWCGKIRKLTKDRRDLFWAWDLAGMMQLSLAVFGIGVMALSLEYWIGFWLLMMVVFNLREIVLREVKPVRIPKPLEAYA